MREKQEGWRPMVSNHYVVKEHERHFDLLAFMKRKQAILEGAGQMLELPRLSTDFIVIPPSDSDEFSWALQSNTLQKVDEKGEICSICVLTLTANAKVYLECQRCLMPFEFICQAHTQFYVFETEEQADAYSHDDEYETIVGSSDFDLLGLIEDELLLALPLVPKHEYCPEIHPALLTGQDGGGAKDEADILLEEEENEPSLVSSKAFDILKKLKH